MYFEYLIINSIPNVWYSDDTPPSVSGYLGYNSAIGAGIYKNSNVVTVYGIPSLNSSKATELHTYPIGIVDHVLALEGPQGFLSIYDEVNIGGKVVSSSNQTVVDAKNFQVKDGLLNYLGDRSGRWVVFPQGSGYVLRWLGGTSLPASLGTLSSVS
jgi:hypothetical protein